MEQRGEGVEHPPPKGHRAHAVGGPREQHGQCAAASELVRRGGRPLGQTRQRVGRSGELAKPRVPKLVRAPEDGKDGA